MITCSFGNVLEELLTLLKLEKIEANIFRGQSQDLGFGSVFGGQVLGQALSAASQTVAQSRAVHSLHAYFLRPGDAQQPIVYTVERLRDGKSFSTRRVVALQKGRTIFSLAASFQISEPGFDHQDEMPVVPGPEGFDSEETLALKWEHKMPVAIRDRICCVKPIEIRHVNPSDPFETHSSVARRYIWFRAIGPLPEDRAIHRYMLAYASDFNLMPTALYGHGHTFWERDMQVASLDHAMWFHRDFQMDDWMLYAIHSPSACMARGQGIGQIYTRRGVLAATVVQEGLMRYHGFRGHEHEGG
jgi:acyl-CoA thioesterase II